MFAMNASSPAQQITTAVCIAAQQPQTTTVASIAVQQQASAS